MQKNTDILWQKIQVLYRALQKQSHWYTGLSIKKYLKQEIFTIDEEHFNNQAIGANRWSAYCHYSLLESFKNLLNKNQVKTGSQVLVHPLLPAILVQELINEQINILTIDVDKTTWGFDSVQFTDFLSQNKNLDLVIHYGMNGLYEGIIQQVKQTDSLVVPSLVVIDNFDINPALLQVFSEIKMGGLLWNFGDSFWDDQLNTVLESTLPSRNWFVSFQIENRTRSMLEYHLSQSHEIYLPTIEAFFYLLLEKYKSKNLMGHIFQFAGSKFFLKSNFNSHKEAVEKIQSNYQEIFNFAIPDPVFDLQVNTPVNFHGYKMPQKLIHSSNYIQDKARFLYNYFLASIPNRPNGSLEVPSFYLHQVYLKYFFFSTEAEFWYNHFLQTAIVVQNLPKIHDIFRNSSALVNAKFVNDYGLMINTVANLEKTVPLLANSQPQNP